MRGFPCRDWAFGSGTAVARGRVVGRAVGLGVGCAGSLRAGVPARSSRRCWPGSSVPVPLPLPCGPPSCGPGFRGPSPCRPRPCSPGTGVDPGPRVDPLPGVDGGFPGRLGSPRPRRGPASSPRPRSPRTSGSAPGLAAGVGEREGVGAGAGSAGGAGRPGTRRSSSGRPGRSTAPVAQAPPTRSSSIEAAAAPTTASRPRRVGDGRLCRAASASCATTWSGVSTSGTCSRSCGDLEPMRNLSVVRLTAAYDERLAAPVCQGHAAAGQKCFTVSAAVGRAGDQPIP